MINRETIWMATCQQDSINISADSIARINVLTAIHHYSHGSISELNLCSELSLRIRTPDSNTNLAAEITMTAEQFEELGRICSEAAARVRNLQAALDEDAAEIAEAQRQSIALAKDSA